MRVVAYQGLKDYKNAAASLESVIKSGLLPAAEMQPRQKAVALLYYQAGDKVHFVEAASAYIQKYGYEESLVRLLAANAVDAKNFQEAARYSRQLIDAEVKQGKKPDEELLKVLLAAADQKKDPDALFDAYSLMLKYYPRPEYWQQLVQRTKVEPGFDSGNYGLDIYRVLTGAGIPVGPEERAAWAEEAFLKGLPGEAAKVLEDGYKIHQLGVGPKADRQQRLLDEAHERVAKDKPTLPGLEQEAKASPNGQVSVATGEAYMSYGENAKAAELLAAGLNKKGVTNINAAKLHLGIAQYKAGNADAARKTWATITGKDGSARLAKIWTLVSQTNPRPASAGGAAAP
jgi:hypothetical protein